MNAAQSGGHTGGGGVGKKGSQMEELVGITNDRRNWRGIFIALLVIAIVFSLIIFSIFLLTPDGENLRHYGTPLSLNDVISEKYRWVKFNGSWHNENEIVYRDVNDGISLLNVQTLNRQILISITVLRQLNVETYSLSPDSNFILLQTDNNVNGTRCFIYELATENIFPLWPSSMKEIDDQPPRLQLIEWSPLIKSANTKTSSHRSNVATANLKKSNQMNASIQSSPTIINDNESTFSMQGIAFVYENDIYYKAAIQENSETYRITTTGQFGVIYNGVPNWLYSNDPDLASGKANCMQFSPDGKYLAYITFNDSSISEYRYTWLGDTSRYPTVLSQRYPKYGMNNPEVTIYVVNLNAVKNSEMKDVTSTLLQLPLELIDKVGYIGGLQWVFLESIRTICISALITNRAQTRTSTILCEAPNFQCTILHTEFATNYSTVLTAEKVTFPSVIVVNSTVRAPKSFHSIDADKSVTKSNGNDKSQGRLQVSSSGINFLKRIPVQSHRDHHHHYRQIVFISSEDRRKVIPLTNDNFEVTEIIGWDKGNEVIYFMAVPLNRSEERHLYKIRLQLIQSEKFNRTHVISTEDECICLTCSNRISTTIYNKLRIDHTKRHSSKAVHSNCRYFSEVNEHYGTDDDDDHNVNNSSPVIIASPNNNCLYNNIQFNEDYSYYIQECLGPEVPSIYLVETQTNKRIFTLDSGDLLRHSISQTALPQIRILDVEISNGFHTKVKLFIPPDVRDESETTYPLILHVDASPGSQLVNQRFDVTWNWYLCSQREFVVAQIDGRGSGFQGEELRAQVYGKLGKFEVEDQLAILKYLSVNIKFIDSSRICAYGWGYGGYVTSMALIEDSEQLLRCAIAINPITTLTRFYSYFVERFVPPIGNYMQALQDAELSLHAGNIKGRNLMLIHSTADTFIHQEHALVFIKALVNQNVKFKQQIYPDEDHDIEGALSHVYRAMEWYMDDCFSLLDDYDWNPSRLFVF